VKIRRVAINNRKAQLEVTTGNGGTYSVPFSRLTPQPSAADRVREAAPDPELGNEAVTYALESGAEGSIHLDSILEYNRDPRHLSELMLHELTIAARERIETCGLSRREIARLMGTSLPQLYRLLDPANTSKSLNQMVSLLHVLGCDVSLVVKPRRRRAA
jgi:hypothetical protein